jgi:hypothetical protein
MAVWDYVAGTVAHDGSVTVGDVSEEPIVCAVFGHRRVAGR